MPRIHGDGSIRQRKDGRWEARLRDGSKQVSIYGKTRRDVAQQLKKARERLDAGKPVRDANRTVADWAAQWVEVTLPASGRAATTRDQYTILTRKHIIDDELGSLRLGKVTGGDVERWLGRKATQGYAASTRRTMYAVLRAILDTAVRDRLLARNPVHDVKRPAQQSSEAAHLAPAEVARILDAARSSRYHPVLVLIAATGCRKGEALGLRWRDINLSAAQLTIRGSLARTSGGILLTEAKSATSRREVPLHQGVVAMLRDWKRQQQDEKLAAGNVWEEGTLGDLVFRTELGRPVDPRNVLRAMETAARRCGIAVDDVHALRHSAATAWLEAGVHVKAVSSLLGHSSISITGDLYGHRSEEAGRSAVDGLGDALGF
ncbi:site-specific integrase [Hoyosella sp. G463]|uniref:Site-specific integrase n=1 Tax=Lolliginicoccus lacisalsi TaxID=2742202 RepID=A0A927PLL9_9ACTN|nr:site-specific integrase [Lolliginicoccus lacisalsi]MBD8505521.1 site-specific integrase [Lolliginicoccus lacisalsi]